MISGCKPRALLLSSTYLLVNDSLRSQPPKTAAIANDTRVGTSVL